MDSKDLNKKSVFVESKGFSKNIFKKFTSRPSKNIYLNPLADLQELFSKSTFVGSELPLKKKLKIHVFLGLKYNHKIFPKIYWRTINKYSNKSTSGA